MPKYAAIDIGSNSIRLMVADIDPGRKFEVLAEDRSVTRLGQSVFETGKISGEATEFALGVLARMNSMATPFEPLATRVVATAALRDASNSEEFIERAATAAGTPIEIISGQEEARLIQLGVETRWPHPQERILIVDVGGGSAEIIESVEGRLEVAFSRPLGAVRLHSVFLQNDPPAPEDLHRLIEFIDEKLAPAARKIQRGGFTRAIGTSASASAAVSAVNRIPRAKRDLADRRRASTAQLRRLYKDLAAKNLPQRRKAVGIGPRRAEIIVPGLAVLLRTMETFQIPTLAYCAAGVRDGVLRDLSERGVGRERIRLSRQQREAVEQFARRFGVDLRHARKVAHFARDLFEGTADLHRLQPEQGRILEASSLLRDVGHAINDAAHHKHSQYIVANSDLAGFTDHERLQIALLCRYHRKSMPTARHAEFQGLSPDEQRVVLLLAPLLRVADALDRSRDQRGESISIQATSTNVRVSIESEKDTSLEEWAVETAAGAFRQAYDRSLQVARMNS
jgi:exopolyphosphatase/guanosine-5'-triphosphate,3'-diphosphate pyrophosphatase